MTTPSQPRDLLDGFSLEMTGKDIAGLEAARDAIPPGTRVNVTFLGHEDMGARIAAALAVRRAGFVPVPHVAARLLSSPAGLDGFLGSLATEAGSTEAFVVAGDPAEPAGPYADALSIIRSGALHRHGFGRVSVGGYPEGHPQIDTDTLWQSLEDKTEALRGQGLDAAIITQFGFDPEPVLVWLAEVRNRGIDLPVRIGVPGPAGVRRLLAFARRFGVASSAGVAQKYGFSLANLLGTAGPDRFIRDFAAGYVADTHGEVAFHFYTFGGIGATVDWIAGFRGE